MTTAKGGGFLSLNKIVGGIKIINPMDFIVENGGKR
jgi:hypothetical protein